LPDSVDLLATFPGIGRATASSIIAFAHNKPTAFIETNIRTVFIYFFFKNAVKITDKEIQLLVEETVDHNNPREWYYALMDYGVMLKKTVGNLNRLSAHYHKQSKFQGSDRQIRGQILQVLLDQPGIETAALVLQLGKEEARVLKIIDDLCQESFIQKRDSQLWLAKNS
jgi:A/G-specific adenine glycosylase